MVNSRLFGRCYKMAACLGRSFIWLDKVCFEEKQKNAQHVRLLNECGRSFTSTIDFSTFECISHPHWRIGSYVKEWRQQKMVKCAKKFNERCGYWHTVWLMCWRMRNVAWNAFVIGHIAIWNKHTFVFGCGFGFVHTYKYSCNPCTMLTLRMCIHEQSNSSLSLRRLGNSFTSFCFNHSWVMPYVWCTCTRIFLISFRWNWLNRKEIRVSGRASERNIENGIARAVGNAFIVRSMYGNIDWSSMHWRWNCWQWLCWHTYSMHVYVCCRWYNVFVRCTLSIQRAKATRLQIDCWCWLMPFYTKYLIWMW